MNEIEELKEKVRSLKVLFVDDEKEIRDGSGVFLRKFFDNVVVCSDGEKALEVFSKAKDFDIVITDIIMPKMDGVELIKEVNKIDADVFTVFITASRSVLDNEKELCNTYLRKPISFDDIVLIMQKVADLK